MPVRIRSTHGPAAPVADCISELPCRYGTDVEQLAVAVVMTDLWGVAIPGWIGAIGGSASAIVAVAAWIQSLRNKKTSEVLSSAFNERAQSGDAREPTTRDAQPRDSSTPAAAGVAYLPVTWGIEKDGRHYRLVNRSTVHTAHILAVDDISGGRQDALTVPLKLPVDLGPGASMPFTIEKSLVSAAVTALEITWHEEGQPERSVTLFV